MFGAQCITLRLIFPVYLHESASCCCLQLQLCAFHHYHLKCCTSQPKISGTPPGICAFHYHMETLPSSHDLLIPPAAPRHTHPLLPSPSLLLFIDYWHEELKLASDLCS